MQPSNGMLRRLQALAAIDPRPLPVEDQALRVPCDNAYTLGVVDGQALLARELLEDLARGECTPGTRQCRHGKAANCAECDEDARYGS